MYLSMEIVLDSVMFNNFFFSYLSESVYSLCATKRASPRKLALSDYTDSER